MTVDVATLGIAVTSNAEQAAVGLDRLAGAGERAENATDKLKSSSASATSATSALGDAIAQATGRLAALKASTDPVGTAIDRVNAEFAENEALMRSGSLTADQYARNQIVLAQRLDELHKKQIIVNSTMAAGGRVARLSTTEALNLSRQFADIGVTAAMGMNPLMIAIQQGPQIADIMKTSGMGIGGIAKELGIMLGVLKVVNVEQATQVAGNAAVATSASAAAAAETALASASARAAGAAGAATAAAGAQTAANGAVAASATASGAAATAAAGATAVALAPLGAIILGVVGVLAVLGGAWGLATRAANKEIGDNIDHLKLSEVQLKRLKDEGTETGVTMGDTFRGLGTTIKEMFFNQFGEQIDWLGNKWSQGMDWLTTNGIKAVKVIGGGFNGAFYAIREVFMSLPSVLSDIFVTAANGVIGIVENLVNRIIKEINRIGSLVNKGAELVGLSPVFGEASFGGFGRIENENAGAAAGAGERASSAFGRGYQAYGSAVDAFGNAWNENTRASRDARVMEDAGDPNKERKGRKQGLSEEERELQRATKAAESYIANLKEETAQIGLNTIQRHRYAVSIAEAAAPTEELKKQIRDAGQAWEDATIAEAQSQLVKTLREQNEEIAHEAALQGMNAREREVANAQREISIRLAEAEADGIPIATAAIKEQTDAIIANAEARGQLKLDAENAREFADAMGSVADRANDAAESIRGLFGTFGDAVADIMSQYADYEAFVAETNARIREIEADTSLSYADQQREKARASEELAQAQIQHYGDMLTAAKGFFEEGSTGYKVMQAAEQAYRLYQFAMAVKAMFFDTAETTSAVANAGVRMGVDAAETASSVSKSGIRAAADGVAAFAKTLASLPFPFNLAAGAAVLAALVSVGVAMSGKGGSKGASASAAVAPEPTPTTYTPFISHDRPASSPTGANDNRIAPPQYSNYNQPQASKTNVFDFSGANFSGADPEAVKAAVKQGIQEATPDILMDARQQTFEDLQQLNRQKLGG